MSFNPEKMATLIRNECESIEERYPGYKKRIIDAIVEILTAEKKNKAQKTTIQKNVDKVCHRAGDFLWQNQDKEATQ